MTPAHSGLDPAKGTRGRAVVRMMGRHSRTTQVVALKLQKVKVPHPRLRDLSQLPVSELTATIRTDCAFVPHPAEQ